MATTIRIPTPLRPLVEGKSQVDVSGANTVRQAIEQLSSSYEGIAERICDDEGQVRRFVNLFVNDTDIRVTDGLDTALKDGDVLSIVPAIAGGR